MSFGSNMADRWEEQGAYDKPRTLLTSKKIENMPTQLFKITRAKEEPPLSAIELQEVLWHKRAGSEWNVVEVKDTLPHSFEVSPGRVNRGECY